MLRLWADLLPLTLTTTFYTGPAYTLAVGSSSFLSADTVTIYTISVSEASEGTATNLPQTISVGLSALGTLSDGSTTTYLEEEVEFQSTISGDVTTKAPGPTTTAILIEGASGYQLLESSSDSWKDIQCSFDGSSNGGCVESAGIVSSNVISSSGTQADNIALFTTSYFGSLDPFFTLAVSTLASSASSTATPTTSPTPLVGAPSASTSKHTKRNVVGRAVGGAIGGGLFIAILAWLMILLLRRNRQRKKSPSQQYMSSISSNSRGLPPDVNDLQSQTGSLSIYTSAYAAPYNKSSGLRPWSTESRSTFKDDSLTPAAISGPFVPPPPRTEIPEAPPPERLPSDLRNRPSRFIEQLSVNSTDLNVLVAIAKAEAAQKQKGPSGSGQDSSVLEDGHDDSPPLSATALSVPLHSAPSSHPNDVLPSPEFESKS